MQIALMKEAHERLQEARKKAGYADAPAAAAAMGIPQATYFGHENGNRGLARAASRYARFYNVSLDWLVDGKGAMKAGEATPSEGQATVPLVGYVGAGASAHFFGEQQTLGDVTAPQWATEKTVAVEIRGDSLGSFFDHWLVFYDDVHRPMVPELVGKLCIVGLPDGRILIKKVQRSRTRGRYHLLSQNEDPILDVEIDWVARVRSMSPH